MRILIDENLNVRLRHLFQDDDVSTVEYMGWKGLDNGSLLDAAEQHGFDLVITGDTNMVDQQNWHRRTIKYVLTGHDWPLTPDHEQKLLSMVDRHRR